MDRALEELVWQRARHRCEYCQTSQEFDALTFHIDHIIALSHGGPTRAGNLALACFLCNSHKGPNLAGLLNGKLYPLFNPRTQNWKRHFRWDHTTLVGKTKTGIVTVQVLNINETSRLMLRENLLFEGRFPFNE